MVAARTPRVTANEFVMMYLKAHKEGKTNAEFCDSIGWGTDKSAISKMMVRKYQLRVTQNITLPPLKRKQRPNVDYDTLRIAVQRYMKGK